MAHDKPSRRRRPGLWSGVRMALVALAPVALDEALLGRRPAVATSLRNRGYAPDTFAIGDTLVVTGHPARADGAHAVDVFGREAGITRADGTSVP